MQQQQQIQSAGHFEYVQQGYVYLWSQRPNWPTVYVDTQALPNIDIVMQRSVDWSLHHLAPGVFTAEDKTAYEFGEPEDVLAILTSKYTPDTWPGFLLRNHVFNNLGILAFDEIQYYWAIYRNVMMTALAGLERWVQSKYLNLPQ